MFWAYQESSVFGGHYMYVNILTESEGCQVHAELLPMK